eukprot:comp16297_c0_seq1/m.14065 comp16297_c0_seq1/g.14065  ORF comp16297_c0_seq1/g.14065 comp16297_c0_seq1/m.14065 type:complete len:478 (-) comp16297_c0_seq1:261-1694(-)
MRLAGVLVVFADLAAAVSSQQQYGTQRPPPANRTFHSAAIESVITDMTHQLADKEVAELFANCFPNTLDTTVLKFEEKSGGPETFVITGDIPAMWLRDSANQVMPYMPYASSDPHLSRMLCGLVRLHAKNVVYDPYANAFNYAEEGGDFQTDDRKPKMTPHLHEGKYELDSLASFFKLSCTYFQHTKNSACFENSMWVDAVEKAVEVIINQTAGSDEILGLEYYLFQRNTTIATDTLMMHGRGPPARRCGLTRTYFRPSDDSVVFPYNIPANAMVSVELAHVADLLETLPTVNTTRSSELAHTCRHLATQIREAIMTEGVVTHPVFGSIYAYEVDGFGSHLLMDDPGIPSLLSLPYLGFCTSTDPIYVNTRNFVLSRYNPFYTVGTHASGIASPHLQLGFIWPMSIIVQALTSTDDEEITGCLAMLKRTTAGTGFMHESFWKDDPKNYTRPWFAWANTLFGELVLSVVEKKPHLLLS